MSRLILVRHGQAAGGWGDDLDPGLSDHGRRQANEMARTLAPLGPLPIVVSPLQRTRQTAAPLETTWRCEAAIEPGVGEIKSPSDDLADRSAWLSSVMAGRWDNLPPDLNAWRASVLESLLAIDGDAVVVTHFIAINAAVGAALGDDRVVCFAPDNCSRTTLEATGDGLRVIELGSEAATVVR